MPEQMSSILKQLVDNGALNTTRGTLGGNWAKFYDGHPEACPDTSKPFFFAYGFGWSFDYSSNCKDRGRAVINFGLQVDCQDAKNESKASTLWHQARLLFSTNGETVRLPGTYQLSENGTPYLEVENALISDLGIFNPSLTGGSAPLIRSGKMIRYQARLQFEFLVARAMPEIKTNSIIRKL